MNNKILTGYSDVVYKICNQNLYLILPSPSPNLICRVHAQITGLDSLFVIPAHFFFYFSNCLLESTFSRNLLGFFPEIYWDFISKSTGIFIVCRKVYACVQVATYFCVCTALSLIYTGTIMLIFEHISTNQIHPSAAVIECILMA